MPRPRVGETVESGINFGYEGDKDARRVDRKWDDLIGANGELELM